MMYKHYKLTEHELNLKNMSSDEFDAYIEKKYINLFNLKKSNPYDAQSPVFPISFGIEINPGWRHIIDDLCAKLLLIYNLTGVLASFTQIKEKFGTGRIYYHITFEKELTPEERNITTNIIDELVNNAEAYTEYVCDIMGTNIEPWQHIRIGGWVYGCGLEGFKILEKDYPARIEIAEQYTKRQEKINNIKDVFNCNLTDDELELIDKTVSKILFAKNL